MGREREMKSEWRRERAKKDEKWKDEEGEKGGEQEGRGPRREVKEE